MTVLPEPDDMPDDMPDDWDVTFEETCSRDKQEEEVFFDTLRDWVYEGVAA
jgi:hypothetical protein